MYFSLSLRVSRDVEWSLVLTKALVAALQWRACSF